MAVTISQITVHVSGRVGSTVTRLEVDGAEVAIALDRTWTCAKTVPTGTGTRTVTITAISPKGVDARTVEIGGGTAPVAAG